MTADQVPHREADSNEGEAIVMQLTLPISDDSWYFPLFRPHNTARPTSTRLERDPLGPRFLRRLEARGSSKKGVTEKAAQDISPTKTPLGNRNATSPEGQRIIMLDPEVAPLVRQLFE